MTKLVFRNQELLLCQSRGGERPEPTNSNNLRTYYMKSLKLQWKDILTTMITDQHKKIYIDLVLSILCTVNLLSIGITKLLFTICLLTCIVQLMELRTNREPLHCLLCGCTFWTHSQIAEPYSSSPQKIRNKMPCFFHDSIP